MRIHTSTEFSTATALGALRIAQSRGQVARGVYFDKLVPHRSTTHRSAAEVHLVTDDKEPGSKRRRPNSGQYGYDGSEVWAATWDEWGWFLSALFELDPTAKTTYYADREAFDRRTSGAFVPTSARSA